MSSELHERARALILDEDWPRLQQLGEEWTDSADPQVRMHAFAYISESFSRRGNLVAALAAAQRAETAQPNSAASCALTARLFLLTGDLARAARRAEHALSIAHDHSGIAHQCFGTLAMVARREDRIADAAKFLRRSFDAALLDYRFLQVLPIDYEFVRDVLGDPRTVGVAASHAERLQAGLTATRRTEDAFLLRELLENLRQSTPH